MKLWSEKAEGRNMGVCESSCLGAAEVVLLPGL